MRYIFTCGGTGGHVFPAIAVAEQLKKTDRNCAVLFAGNENGMEYGIVKRAGFDFVPVGARPLVRKAFAGNIVNAFFNIAAFFKAVKIVSEFKPDFVFGTGGFVSFPVCLMASLLGKKTVIHEPNTYPGLANLWLAPFVSAITAGFDDTAKHFPEAKCYVTGNPVREGILKMDRKAGKKAFGIKSGKTLLVMPGSRAAKSVNAAVLKALPLLAGIKGGLNLIWMCGEKEFGEINAAVKRVKKPRVILKSFIEKSDLAYAACDAALLRAGASTLTEITAGAVPSVLVPYPHATGNHQEKNAASFEKRGAAIVIKDNMLGADSLVKAVKKALEKGVSGAMKKNLKAMYRGNGAVAIARMLTNKEFKGGKNG